MRYYLDFDRTTFDTDAFKVYLAERPDTASLLVLPESEAATALNEMAMNGTLSFAPGELSQFLYPEVAGFLRDKENAASIITFGNEALQKIKVKSALYGIPRTDTLYTGEIRKGHHLAPHPHLHENALLVDDTPLELEILANECPSLKLYEMRRDGGAGDGRWPVIHSLSELP